MLKSSSLRHVTSLTSHDTQFIYLGIRIIGPPVVLRTIMGEFISVHDNRTLIDSKLPIMGEFCKWRLDDLIVLILLREDKVYTLLNLDKNRVNGPWKRKSVFTLLSRNPMHLEYENFILRNFGNSQVQSYEKNITCLYKKLYTHKKKIVTLVLYILKMNTN